ncbi:MAG: D-alanyl-D-alanine carboxypeptidase/D-alanyl-D-alanine-endopeptidase [Flavobacteriales bacterium]|jgi:D-alanyl-D-alanine carboxypeptidase/D-alanyl-D-alanine-endopeptidase (penicillin-binding protein 4)
MKSISLLVLFLGMANFISAQKPADAFSAFVNNEELNHTSVGFSLLDPSGIEIQSFQSEKSLAPASTVKVLTSITALEILGYDHKFVTTLIIQGTIIEGRLIGNVIVKSGGDPTLGAPDFKTHYGDFVGEWVKAIKAEGISEIDGRILIDDRALEGDRNAGSTALNDVGNYYGAGAPGFSFMDNEFTVFFNTAGSGTASVVVKTEPSLPVSIELVNEVRAGNKSGDNVIIYSLDGGNQVFLKGELPPNMKDFKVRGAFPDVTQFAQAYLQRAIESAGISVTEVEKNGPLFMNSKELVQTKSPALIEILKVLNKKSVNSYADVLLKHIGKASGRAATFEGGAEAVKAFWKEKGLDTNGIYIEDGSGLSRKNNITAKFMTEVLQSQLENEQVNKIMNEASLSFSVKSMWGSAFKGQIQAKSGYIGRVIAYAGYIIRDGKKYPFYLTVNNFSGSTSGMRTLIGTALRGVRLEL